MSGDLECNPGSTTLNYCVDLYGAINACRNNLNGILNLFIKAYEEK